MESPPVFETDFCMPTIDNTVEFPLIVKVWAGGARHDWNYLRRSLPSLLESRMPPHTRVILVDDCSPDPRLRPFLENLSAGRADVELWTNPERLGPNKGQ